MSSFSSACKTIHVSPSSSLRERTCDCVGVMLSQGGCLTHDQGQMFATEFGLMEVSEVEYTHFQHLIQTQVEAQGTPPRGPDARSPPATEMVRDATESTVISPITTTQAIDLSTSTDEHCLMQGEKTPASYGDVPGFVLARVIGEDSPAEPLANSSTSSQKRSRSAARVCLEKRFSTMSADTPRQQDVQSALLSNFLTVLQQSAEAQETFIHPQMQKWMKLPFEVSSPFVGDVFNTVTNMCEQMIGHKPHMAEPKHEGLIIPKNFLLRLHPERVVTKAHYTTGSNSTDDMGTPSAVSRKHGSTHSSQAIKAAKAAPGSAGISGRKRAKSHMLLSQQRERHNSKERERRKKIRSYCDELNTLVPFCNTGSDKVTTLQWTTAFLRYINKTYGDAFKEEFQKAFTDEKGLFLKSSPSPGQDPIQQEMDETLSIPLVVEQ